MIRLLAVMMMVLGIAGIASCAPTEIPDLKSPCASAEIPGVTTSEHPCARRPVNDWWLKKQGLPIPYEKS